MPLFSGSAWAFIGEIGGKFLVELGHPTAKEETKRKPCFRSFSVVSAAFLWWMMLHFWLWLNLVL